MNRIETALRRVVADLDDVLASDAIAGLTDAEKMRVLGAAGDVLRRIEAVIVETAASAEPRLPETLGCRSMNELLQRVLRVDAPSASKVTKAAAAVRREVALASGERLPARYPALRAAMLDGVIGVAGMLAATAPLEQAGIRIGAAERSVADAALADLARGLPDVDAEIRAEAHAGADSDAAGEGAAAPPATADDLRQLALLLAMALDPDGSEPNDVRAQQRRFLTIGRLRDGCTRCGGICCPTRRRSCSSSSMRSAIPRPRGRPLPV